LAQVYHRQNRYSEAEKTFQKALRIAEQSDPQSGVAAATLNNLGILYRQQMRFDEAERLFKRAIRITGKEKADVRGVYLTALALNYFDQGRNRQAAAVYREALQVTQQALGPTDPQTATAEENLGLVYYRQNHFPQAEKLFRDALSQLNKQATQ